MESSHRVPAAFPLLDRVSSSFSLSSFSPSSSVTPSLSPSSSSSSSYSSSSSSLSSSQTYSRRLSRYGGWVLGSARCDSVAMAAMVGSVLIFAVTMMTVVVADGSPGATYVPKGVQVSLRAKWSGTSLLLEAGEFVAATRKDLFWPFVEEWMRDGDGRQCATGESSSVDERCAAAMADSVRRLLGPEFEPIFLLSLSFREYSPKLVVYRQLAWQSLRRFDFLPSSSSYSDDDATAAEDGGKSERHVSRPRPGNSAAAAAAKHRHRLDSTDPFPPNGSCCWVDVGGPKPLLHPSELDTWIKRAKLTASLANEPEQQQQQQQQQLVEVHSFDHVISDGSSSSSSSSVSSASASASASVAVLYGAVGTACFEKMHAALSPPAREEYFKYVYRPVLPHGCGGGDGGNCITMGAGADVTLGGYGVELALKNMEYSAIDDSSVKKDVATESGKPSEDLDRAVNGFIFSKLLARRPEKAAELLTFRDHLMSAADIDDKINVWDLKDIGLLASQRIAQASDPLRLLQEINHNFPSVVSSLSRMKLNKTVSDEILSNQRMLMAGKNLLAINQAVIDLENLDIFTLMEITRKEISLGSQLSKLKLPREIMKQMMNLPEPSLDMVVRVDVRSDEFVHFLNDLETDAKYRRWGNNLFELLMPMFPGQMRYIRKNLFTAVFVIDPGSPKSLRAVDSIMHYYNNNVPVRFGIIIAAGEVSAIIEEKGGGGEEVVKKALQEENANVSQSASLITARVFYHVVRNFGAKEGFSFLAKLNEVWGEGGAAAGGGGGGGEAPSAGVDSQQEEEEEPISQEHVEEALRATVKRLSAKEKKEKKEQLGVEELIAELRGNLDYLDDVIRSTLFAHKKGLVNAAGAGIPCLVMNGLVFTSNQVLIAMNEELGRIQEKVYYGLISQKTNVLDKLLQENGFARYNPVVLSSDGTKPKYVELATAAVEKEGILRKLRYLHHPGSDDEVKAITHLVVVDMERKEGKQLVLQVLRHLAGDVDGKSRVGILHNPRRTKDRTSATRDDHDPEQPAAAAAGGGGGGGSLLPRILLAAMSLPGQSAKLLPFLQTLLESSAVAELMTSTNKLQALGDTSFLDSVAAMAKSAGLKPDGLVKSLTDSAAIGDAVRRIEKEQEFAKSLGIEPGLDAVITNGRVLLLGRDCKRLTAEDLELLGKVEYSQRVSEVEALMEDLEWSDADPDDVTSEFLSTMIMAASSAVSSRTKTTETAKFEFLSDQHSAIVHQEDKSLLTVDAILDPISTTAQAITPLLILLRDWLQPSFRIVLNPQTNLAEIPLKNFYRFAQPLKKDLASSLQDGAAARFINMPASRTLTMNMYVPEPWLVEPVVAPYDLDNLQLQKLDVGTMHVVFELEALMVTGHCFEQGSRDPPRGLQLLLGTQENPHVVDTIVMANLGYFQLKAAPGVWALRLAPGRSVSLYTIVHADADNTLIPEKREAVEEEAVSVRVVVSDLKGKVVRMKVKKRPGQEAQKILWEEGDFNNEDDDQGPAMAGQGAGGSSNNKRGSSWSDWFLGLGGSRKQEGGSNESSLEEGSSSDELQPASRRTGEMIHIFSVASGHLYERFLRIMILSVVKNTNRPVKFWFIKNYLSPSFKDLIPHMSREYDFEYELVTYKWPSWLHKQVEKQRIIWAYKILFLDVLFPLSLKKVIFVDADQIVRTDLGDLYDMDLKGKPLAYTPFCDNNKEMDGYRFWKQGFWRDHLRGRPYHISALYVVHLAKFRLMAAGDHLRVVYESLSRDPNSLSNLDQDLPNYAQHKVPIFSLPMEWLWCESWCGNATKAKAKTIDLCNNPMTKEPKLEGAKRIVAEWPALDEEQRIFTAKIESNMYMEPQPDTTGHPDVDLKSPEESASAPSSMPSKQSVEGEEGQKETTERVVDPSTDDQSSCPSAPHEEEGKASGSAVPSSTDERDEL